jgi:membrane protease YdiL (CAAX protease family)
MKTEALMIALKAAGVFLVGVVVLMIASVLAQTLTQIFGASWGNPPWLLPALTHAGMLSVALGAIYFLHKRRGLKCGMSLPKQWPVWPIVALSLGVGLAANVILKLLNLQFNPIGEFSTWQIIIFIWIFASAAEETLCRGLLQTLWARVLPAKGSPYGSILLGALFFALMHLPLLALGVPGLAVVIIMIAAFILGCIAGYARAYSGSLLPAILVHALFNVSGSLTMWLAE